MRNLKCEILEDLNNLVFTKKYYFSRSNYLHDGIINGKPSMIFRSHIVRGKKEIMRKLCIPMLFSKTISWVRENRKVQLTAGPIIFSSHF